jgi:hypothetical protein
MPPQNIQQEELNATITKLRSDLDALSGAYFKNNFSGSQTFNKDAIFQTRLRVPVFSSAPAVAEVGDIMAVAGVLYICTVAGSVASPATFAVVGTQS